MRVLGLDIGERRIGVAVSDPRQRVASPLCVLDAGALRDARAIADLVSEYEVGLIVVGLPLSLDGEEGPQAQKIRSVGTRIAEHTGVDVEFADERLTSAEASRAMGAAGLSEKEKRGRIDMVAAALILQSYLDQQVGESSENGRPGSEPPAEEAT